MRTGVSSHPASVLLDATPLDLAALIWFLIVWLGYGWIAHHVPGRPIGLNHHMFTLRRSWMERMLERDNRIVDSQLVGHTIHSVTFFASTTMLVLAGLLSVFAEQDHIYGVVTRLPFTVRTSEEFFEAKLFLLIGLFVHGFFKLTWSLRQFNYLLALMGSAPLAPVKRQRRVQTARGIAVMLSQAVTSFTTGLRAYYFAFAALAWFIQPWLFMAMTTGMLAVLINRQVFSRSFRAIESQARQLEAEEAGGLEPFERD
jgi:uncharacterized membrane protein